VRRAIGLAERGRVPGSRIVAPRRPPYFPAGSALLPCRVDPRLVSWPPVPRGIIPSHVWAVPIGDVQRAAAAFAAYGVPVQLGARAMGPTRDGDLAPCDLRGNPAYEWVADQLTGPMPRSQVELEAAMVRDLGTPAYLE